MEQNSTEQNSTTAPEKFESASLRFTVHSKPQCITECDVEALEPLVEHAYKHAVHKVSKHVSLPGFRKGKVPAELVIKNHGDAIDKEWQQAIADACVKECLTLGNIKLLSRDAKVTYKMKSHSHKGALLSLFLETEPQMPHIDPKKMKKSAIKRPEVNEEKVDESIKQTRLFFAKWEAVKDRPVQVGDFVSLDVDVIEETPHVPLFSNTRFEVTEKSMAKWMFDLVIGKNVGDVAEGVSVPDENATEEEKKELSEKKVRLTIRAIDTATLPEMNEDFFKQIGVKSLEEMRSNIENLLNKQADGHVQEEQQKQVSEFLLNDCAFELPATLIEKETEFRFRQLWQDASFQAYWKDLPQEEKTSLIRTVQEQSDKAVRLFYLCRQILSDANIPIAPEEAEKPGTTALELLMQMQNPQGMQKSADLQQAEAYAKFVLEKAQDFVWRHASE